MGMLADQCGRGGGDEVSRIFEVGRNTVSAGTAEFTGKRETDSSAGRIRRPGAGRKSVEAQQPGIVEAVKAVLENNSYGNPEQVLFWTTLSLRGIEKILVEQGFKINRMTVARIITSLGYSRQQNQKMLQAGKPHPDRDAQFLFINKTVEPEFPGRFSYHTSCPLKVSNAGVFLCGVNLQEFVDVVLNLGRLRGDNYPLEDFCMLIRHVGEHCVNRVLAGANLQL